MATLESRLAKLEAARAQNRPDDPQQAAMSRLMSALREALPDDELDFEHMSLTRQTVFQSQRKRFSDKVQELADRIDAGELGDEDRMLLESLPHDALECLDMTAPELVTMLARVEAMY